ncbi:MAG: hypothetical protein ACRC8K_09420 [Waterburya sp.]
MIEQNLVFLQLAQQNSFVSAVELASILDASVSEVRQVLRNLGDLVEDNGNDEWRVVRNIAPERLLSFEERRKRDTLEQSIDQAFYLAGKNPAILRDEKLYRETHTTFVLYIQDRFDYTKSAAYHLIQAAEIVDNLKCPQIVDKIKDINILPTKESQCRPLAKLPPEKQRKAWSKAVELAGNKVPSSRVVKEAISSLIDENLTEKELEPSSKNKELLYKPGNGIDYVVHLDEDTYRLLQAYQDKIGTASKNGAIRRLLDAIAE